MRPLSPIVDSPSSSNNNDNKDRTASHAERNGHSNNDQVVDNGNNSKPNVNGKSEEIQNEESVPSQDNTKPTESTEANTDSDNSIG
ncbi:MAG: hypothetical protein WBZ20_04140 [Nitrososphaeraceae archaeon]